MPAFVNNIANMFSSPKSSTSGISPTLSSPAISTEHKKDTLETLKTPPLSSYDEYSSSLPLGSNSFENDDDTTTFNKRNMVKKYTIEDDNKQNNLDKLRDNIGYNKINEDKLDTYEMNNDNDNIENKNDDYNDNNNDDYNDNENDKEKEYKDNSTIIGRFMEMLNVVQLFHWKTKVYAQHIATDKLYATLQSLIDKYVETMLASNDRFVLKEINIQDVEDEDIFLSKIEEYKKFIIETKNDNNNDNNSRPDLENILDEMLASLNQFTYLMSFH
jgi:hypothetical protein